MNISIKAWHHINSPIFVLASLQSSPSDLCSGRASVHLTVNLVPTHKIIADYRMADTKRKNLSGKSIHMQMLVKARCNVHIKFQQYTYYMTNIRTFQ